MNENLKRLRELCKGLQDPKIEYDHEDCIVKAEKLLVRDRNQYVSRPGETEKTTVDREKSRMQLDKVYQYLDKHYIEGKGCYIPGHLYDTTISVLTKQGYKVMKGSDRDGQNYIR